MSAARHSRGPFAVVAGRIDGRPVIVDATGYAIASLHSNGDPVGMERTRSRQRDADAALLAAAPELLAALREILAINDEDPGTFRKRGGTRRGLSIVAAQDAIAKAEGRP